MSALVEIACENVEPPSWLENLRKFAADFLEATGRSNWDLSLLLCDDGFIRGLNARYRNVDAPTDVLSFENGERYGDGGEERVLAGDIAVSLPFLQKNCAEFSVGADEELKRLVVHGILHLSGLDHATNDFAAEPMLQEQERLLANFADAAIMR